MWFLTLEVVFVFICSSYFLDPLILTLASCSRWLQFWIAPLDWTSVHDPYLDFVFELACPRNKPFIFYLLHLDPFSLSTHSTPHSVTPPLKKLINSGLKDKGVFQKVYTWSSSPQIKCLLSGIRGLSLTQCQQTTLCELFTSTSMATDALTFCPQGYMNFVLIPGDEMALEDQNNLCVLGDGGHEGAHTI